MRRWAIVPFPACRSGLAKSWTKVGSAVRPSACMPVRGRRRRASQDVARASPSGLRRTGVRILDNHPARFNRFTSDFTIVYKVLARGAGIRRRP